MDNLTISYLIDTLYSKKYQYKENIFIQSEYIILIIFKYIKKISIFDVIFLVSFFIDTILVTIVFVYI